jgi:hypothetical protein
MKYPLHVDKTDGEKDSPKDSFHYVADEISILLCTARQWDIRTDNDGTLLERTVAALNLTRGLTLQQIQDMDKAING